MATGAENTGRPLRVLIIEDSEDDLNLLVHELRRSGFEPSCRCVKTAEDLIAALDSQQWDLFIGDYTMPGFSGTQALSIVHSRGLETPFIFVSGTIGEDVAVAAMRAGAQDYVMKENLKRLGPAIERELRESDARRERARAEAERHIAENRFRQILMIASDGIVGIDEDRRIVIFNQGAEAIFGYSAEEVSGQFLDLLLPSRFTAAHRRHMAEFARAPVAARQMNQRSAVFGRRKNGEEFPVEASISKIVENGKTTFMAIIRDITQRQALEEQQRRSQRLGAIGQLTGGLAHDFNNLLAIVIGNLDLLLEVPISKNSGIQGFAQTALGAALRGARLTHQLLAFARGQILEPAAFDLNELVSGTIDLLRRTLGEQIEVETILAGDLWLAHADPKQMETALTNLAINARDAMPNGGRLIIETANGYLDEHYAAENVDVAPGGYVMLTVSDTGIGIPPGILNRVFEPFFTTKEQGKGTGLGLSMVYGFAKQSRGHVKIYSEAGHGTTVRLYLPKAHDDAVPAREEIFVESEMAASSATILVADDNPGVRGIVVEQLTSLGYRVIDAQDGASALGILQKDESIDLLFTDIVMPGGMTGVELAREARQIRPLLKILLTSGFVEESVRNGGRSGEIMNVLSKPYRKQDLARKIQEVLSGKI